MSKRLTIEEAELAIRAQLHAMAGCNCSVCTGNKELLNALLGDKKLLAQENEDLVAANNELRASAKADRELLLQAAKVVNRRATDLKPRVPFADGHQQQRVGHD